MKLQSAWLLDAALGELCSGAISAAIGAEEVSK